MDYADILKWLMVGTVVPLVVTVTVALLFGFVLKWDIPFPGGTLIEIGRAFFVAWWIALFVALIDYYRKKKREGK